MTTGYAANLRNAQLDAITTFIGNGGKLQIYDGTRPATGGTATTKLSEHTCGSPFAPGASAGVLSPTLPANVNALASGTATWFRGTTSGGTFGIDGSVGIAGSGADLIINSTSLISGVAVAVIAWTITRGNP